MTTGKWMILIIAIALMVSSFGCSALGSLESLKSVWKSGDGEKPPVPESGMLTLRDTASGSLSKHEERFYKYDVWDPKGETFTVTSEWTPGDGNVIHLIGFSVYDETQFVDYIRNHGDEKGLGTAAVTGTEADNGPPISRKVWVGKLPVGSYYIRVYSDAESDMDYTITAAKER